MFPRTRQTSGTTFIRRWPAAPRLDSGIFRDMFRMRWRDGLALEMDYRGAHSRVRTRLRSPPPIAHAS